jgi:integrase
MKLHEKGNSPATVMHHLATINAAMRKAEANFGIKVDKSQVSLAVQSLKQLRVAAPSVKRDNRVTDEDLAVILPAFESDHAVIPMEAIVRMAIALPRRREELLTMEWKNISADNTTIKLMDTKDPRKYREETVPIPPAALAIMAGLPKIDDRVLPYKPESVSARWQRAVRRVGKEHLRYHDLRHEGISRLFEQGLTIEEVALISGHTSWATLRRYTHLRPQDVTAKLRRTT